MQRRSILGRNGGPSRESQCMLCYPAIRCRGFRMLSFKPAARAVIFCAFASVPVSAQQLQERNPAASTRPVAVRTGMPSTDEEVAEADSQPERVFRTTVRNLFNEEKFAELEEIANTARSEKSRFRGGAWKLHSFYDAIRTPGSLTDTDAVWNAHVERLQRWITAKPDSSTPT